MLLDVFSCPWYDNIVELEASFAEIASGDSVVPQEVIPLRMLVVACFLCSVLLTPLTATARTWHVRQDGSGDCTTIQACCDSAGWYDTVLVAPGTYPEHVSLDKSLVLISDAGPSVTTIVAPSITHPVLRMYYGGTVADGFTVRDALCLIGWPNVGGVYVGGGTLRNCLVVNNHAMGIDSPGDAGGVQVAGGGAIEGNTIVSNGNWVTAGGIYCLSNFNGQIVRNIVAMNNWGFGIYCEAGANPAFLCNNVWGNHEGEYGGACGNPTGVNGNISVDPLFCDRQNGDYRLCAGSPCINAPGCGQMGAFGVGCGPTAVTPTTWGRIKALYR